MTIYGRNPVLEALRGPRKVFKAWVSDAAHASELPSDLEVKVVSPEELEELAGTSDHQGFVADVESYRYADSEDLLASDDALVVVLDQIQDPRNLGAICRTAESAGAAGVVIPDRRAAEVTPAACKASAGAVEHLAIARVRNVHDYLVEAKKTGAWVYGADADAKTSFDEPDYSGRVVLVMGSEGKGLRPRVADACDQLIAIPMRGMVQSLNVSASAAILIYAARSS